MLSSSIDLKMDGLEDVMQNLNSLVETFGGLDGTCVYKCEEGKFLLGWQLACFYC